jgi:hypothetical protein
MIKVGVSHNRSQYMSYCAAFLDRMVCLPYATLCVEATALFPKRVMKLSMLPAVALCVL